MALLKGFKPPDRPVATTKTYLAAAKIIAKELEWENEDIDAIAADIVEVTGLDRGMDGYEIAKNLEENGYYGLTFEDCSVLNDFSFHVEQELNKEEMFWVKDNDIQPKFKTNDFVSWMFRHERKFGRIVGIHDHGCAEYLIHEFNNDGSLIKNERKIIVKFEHVTKWKPQNTKESKEYDNP